MPFPSTRVVSTMINFLKVSASVRRGNGVQCPRQVATARMRAMVCAGPGAMWTTTPAAPTRSGGLGGSLIGTQGSLRRSG